MLTSNALDPWSNSPRGGLAVDAEVTLDQGATEKLALPQYQGLPFGWPTRSSRSLRLWWATFFCITPDGKVVFLL